MSHRFFGLLALAIAMPVFGQRTADGIPANAAGRSSVSDVRLVPSTRASSESIRAGEDASGTAAMES